MSSEIIPWIEVNSPTNEVVDHYADAPYPSASETMYASMGIHDWSGNATRCIVSARPNAWKPRDKGGWFDAGLLDYMGRMLPTDIDVIQGIAPAGMDWWDTNAWADLFELMKSDPEKIVLLELEIPFHNGDLLPKDMAALFLWVDMLETAGKTKKEIWFNFPRIMPNTSPTEYPWRQSLTEFLVRTVATSIPTAKFLDASVAYVDRDDWTREKMIEAVGEDRLIDRMMVAPSASPVVLGGGQQYFDPTQAKLQLESRDDRPQIVYTDFERWIDVAREWKGLA